MTEDEVKVFLENRTKVANSAFDSFRKDRREEVTTVQELIDELTLLPPQMPLLDDMRVYVVKRLNDDKLYVDFEETF